MGAHTPVLPRCKGYPTPEYARIAEMIYDVAVDELTEDKDETLDRLVGLYFIFDAARDALRIGMNMAADPDLKHRGRVSFREQAEHLELSPFTIQKYIAEGRTLINSEELDTALQKAQRTVAV
jgi:hypothetical protein